MRCHLIRTRRPVLISSRHHQTALAHILHTAWCLQSQRLESGMIISNRHPEVNSVLRVSPRGSTKEGGKKGGEEIGSAGGGLGGEQPPRGFVHFCSPGSGHVRGVQSCRSVFTLDYRDSPLPCAVLPAGFSASPLRHAQAQT